MLQNHLIFWPMLAQMAIPLVVLALNGKRKAADVKSGLADLSKSAMNNEAWSKPVVLTSKNLANQFQFPVIFYGLCVILASINAVTFWTLSIAWAFVVCRAVHAAVHVTHNYVPLRFKSFLVGMFFLLALFVATVVSLARI